MRLTRKGVAALLAAMLLFGVGGAVVGSWSLGELQRYQRLLQTVDALVALAQQNIKDGALKPLPGPPGK